MLVYNFLLASFESFSGKHLSQDAGFALPAPPSDLIECPPCSHPVNGRTIRRKPPSRGAPAGARMNIAGFRLVPPVFRPIGMLSVS